MRTLIVNAVLLDGSGAPPRSPVSVVVEDHLVEEVVERWAPYYDVADVVVDARGGFLLPGVIDHHVHGLTRGPLMIVGEPPLSDARVRANLDRLLDEGVTTALNVDGFPTVEDAEAQSRFHPVRVKVTTLHTPTHLAWATEGPFPFGGVRPRHAWTVDEMLEAGAVCVGEAGPGCDTHWADYTLIPEAAAQRGGRATMEQARAFRQAAERGEREEAAGALAAMGVGREHLEDMLGVHEATVEWQGLARQALQEAIEAGRARSVPLLLHHTPGTFDLVLDAAREAPDVVIAGHSNFQIHDPDDAARRARAVREAGALVDVMSGDAWSARQFHPTPAVTHRLLAEGLVDLVSTDYAGGFWDPMLVMLERAHEAGAVTLEAAVRMVTGAVAEALPALAPRRGRIAPGYVADLVVTEPGRLGAVREVLVSGRVVDRGRRLW
jgi:predicted amidohydrolase